MQDKIRDIAYRLWQQAGSPEGRDLDHWLAAEAEVRKAKASPKAAAPAKKAKPAKKAVAKG